MTEQLTTGCPENAELMAWLDKEVGGARAAEISAHVVGCADCTTEVQRFVAASAAVRQWRIDPLPAKKAAAPKRRLIYWAAAAVVLIGVLSTVRVQCAEETNCAHKQLRFTFLPAANIRGSDIPRPQPALPPSAYQNMNGSMESRFERDWNARRRLQIGVPQGTAKVVVVMFIDWQCPACRAVHKSYLPMIDSFNQTSPGSIKVVMRDYPLNIRCNPNVPVEMHPAACEAAVAVRLAREKHREAEMVEWLFARQQTLTPELVRQAAKDVAGVADLAARYSAVIKDVAAEVELARRLEVGGTPTVFVNGVLARTADNSIFSPREFRMALEVELAKK